VASGAYEKTIPFPGWTLPGVCTPGCALHFATVDRVRVGKRVLVAGSGPFLLPVACSLLEVGASVIAVHETSHPYRFSTTSLAAVTYLKRMRELAQYLSTLRRHRVPIKQGWRVSEALGNGQVERIRFSSDRGQTEEIEVDALCVGYGFRPSTELPRLLGVECRQDPVSSDLVPVIDDFGRTTAAGIYVAGEVTGIGGVDLALISGRLVGVAMALDLGLFTESRKSTVARLLKTQSRLRKFIRLTGRLFSADDGFRSIADDTVVCRCECVTAGTIRRASLKGWNDLQAVKGFTRAGMGPCQGRECGATVARLVADATGSAVEAFPARMPIKPISVPTDGILMTSPQ
jgi:NADPH-dependent 2,4-dienoyl-CoA reductase/sulfur reductase-like enzyme